MKLHEYQAKQILARAGIPIPDGRLARSPEEAEAAAKAIAAPVAVKAQVHTGGRGKAGGIKVAKSPAEAKAAAGAILGMDIKGLRVDKVYVERAADVASEQLKALGFQPEALPVRVEGVEVRVLGRR